MGLAIPHLNGAADIDSLERAGISMDVGEQLLQGQGAILARLQAVEDDVAELKQANPAVAVAVMRSELDTLKAEVAELKKRPAPVVPAKDTGGFNLVEKAKESAGITIPVTVVVAVLELARLYFSTGG